ncbi:MAG: 5-(carboxyamino)imidazole ribonucleotide synthase [Sphingosinicella sp.]|nr:5-(carboxyamino)imidazole ribonucleotide synthase [Sphingosinicella sp.]
MSVPPGSTIGIVGGGQLGRMLAMAAAQLGYRCHIYAPDEAPPAAEVSALFTRGAYDDEAALARFGAAVDVATYEFENIAAGPLSALAGQVALYPPRKALETAQDRLAEKQFVQRLGGRPAPFAVVDSRQDLETALGHIGVPAILKTRRFGYDGKGQARIMHSSDADAAWDAVQGSPSILEGFVEFEHEFSILLCRAGSGEIAIWDAPLNVHAEGILDTSIIPAPAVIRPAVEEATQLSRTIAEDLGHVGLLTLEFFATREGAIFNEMAPRVHNSGHWTIEGALSSQFENHVRAICGLPLGATDLVVPRVEMKNLIGADVDDWREILTDPSAHLHLYGKRHARPGRKMGHVTRLIGAGGH